MADQTFLGETAIKLVFRTHPSSPRHRLGTRRRCRAVRDPALDRPVPTIGGAGRRRGNCGLQRVALLQRAKVFISVSIRYSLWLGVAYTGA